MFDRSWRKRAIAAEAALAEAREYLTGIELRLADRAALISMTKEGRNIRLTFVRNNELTQITLYHSIDFDFGAYEKALLR